MQLCLPHVDVSDKTDSFPVQLIIFTYCITPNNTGENKDWMGSEGAEEDDPDGQQTHSIEQW